MISFWVSGIPQPKGSTRGFYAKKLQRVIITAANSKTRPWEQAIRAEAKIAGCKPVTGPVRVGLLFYLPRPRGHSGKRGLRPSAPMHPITKPDIDKLARAALDAMTHEAWVDDAQVVDLSVTKLYASDVRGPGVRIELSPVAAADAAAMKLCRGCRMFCVQGHDGDSCNCDDANCRCVCKAAAPSLPGALPTAASRAEKGAA